MYISANNNKFLSLVVMAVFTAIFVPTTEAAGAQGSVRHRRSDEKEDNRMLKSGKNSKGGSTSGRPGRPAGTLSATTISTTVTSPTTSVTTGTSVTAWEARCASESNILDNCVGGTDTEQMICKQCVLGIAQLNTVTVSGLKSCSNVAINGALCRDCEAEVLTFYNCGAGASLSIPANLASSINQEVTAGVQATVVASSDYAPISFCPFTMPVSGDSCSTPLGYQYLRCPFGNMICTCRFDTSEYLCSL